MGKYFGTDGIRGVAGETLTADLAYKVGQFLGDYCRKNGNSKICVGKDTRLSSTMLESALARGIVGSGCDAYLIGYCSTPCLAYVAEHDNFEYGVMISASHNPYQDNGIKVFGNNGIKISDELELQIEQYIDGLIKLDNESNKQLGNVCEYQKGIDDYTKWIESIYPNRLDNFKILVDCANGSNSFIAEKVLTDLGCNVKIINANPNGANINSNCGSTHLESLKKEIKNDNYDFGFAFDGDGDRVLFVDRDGETIDGDILMYILSKYLYDNNKLRNNTLVVTVMSNIGLYKALEIDKINLVVTSVGDKNVLDEMIKNDYSIGGEQSGHIILLQDSNFGDGLKTALCVMAAITHYESSITELKQGITIYPQLLKNVIVKDKKVVLNDEDINLLIENVKDELGDEGKVLVRPSGTEPMIRVMVEAKTQELCEQYVNEIVDLIKGKGYQNDN